MSHSVGEGLSFPHQGSVGKAWIVFGGNFYHFLSAPSGPGKNSETVAMWEGNLG